MKSLIWIISWLISGILLCPCTILSIDVNTYLKSLNLSDEEYRKQPGFITSFDRFVDRKEGWKIAKSNNQIQFGNDDEDDVLISENLY